MKRSVIGAASALVSMAILTGVMLPLRHSLSIATTALVLVVPVVLGVVIGGYGVGVLSVIAGFLVYDYFFIPPYRTLEVGAPQNWAALVVYAAVMLPVARLAAGMHTARAAERRQGRELRQLFELSDLLIQDKPLDVLLPVVVTSLTDVFGARQAALFLPAGDRLQVAASAGEPLSADQQRQILNAPAGLASADSPAAERGGLLVLPLTASARPVGLLALTGAAVTGDEHEPLQLFANQIALAVERAQLQEQALRARVTEEMARLARTLVAAVSHDLRGPLASIKASSSTLADSGIEISPDAQHRLARLIDVQADRLAELVRNLLDMSRIQAGVLQPRRSVIAPADLVASVVTDMAPVLRGHPVQVEVPQCLPAVDADVVLISRVLANLLQNAVRHSPGESPITVRGEARPDGRVEVAVTDHGPGVQPDRREEIFGLLSRRPADVGAGLGLTIAKTFVEAHGQRIWVEDAPGGGARFAFTLPAAAGIGAEPALAARADH
jgi:two-component system, OmpR family, sensor histidine kinase KdpD